mmetsp:Transcript_23400/g.64924  ORF Transcript_23400/g.64924 Transcript_23400/m.64924 type:complete len:274 (+) Transcript_23400:403-1224(+)
MIACEREERQRMMSGAAVSLGTTAAENGLLGGMGLWERPGRKCLGQVAEEVGVLRVAFQILPGDKVLNPLLDHLKVGLEHPRQLLHHLQDELLVLQLLSALHGANNRGINSVAAVLVHVLNHLLLLVHHREGDLDALHAVVEVGVEAEGVLLGDVLRVAVLGEDLVLGARQGVQQAEDVLLWQVHALLDLIEGHAVLLVEEQQQGSLEGGNNELDLLGLEVPHDVAGAQGKDPRQLPVLCCCLIKLLEGFDAGDHLLGQSKIHCLVCGPEARC